MEVKSYLRLLFEEALNPFYIFQVSDVGVGGLRSPLGTQFSFYSYKRMVHESRIVIPDSNFR